MLAPMQGLTNPALRSLFIEWVRPDVVFTEFVRVSAVSRKRIAPGDLRQMAAQENGVPLVVQLIGRGKEALVQAAERGQKHGAAHINLNLGCPYGRMTTAATGGQLLRDPAALGHILPALRRAVSGTLSVKMRAGYDNPRTVFDLLPLIEDAGADFIVLHPRTVVQEYSGAADHAITAEVVARTRLPVIANGDIVTAGQGRKILHETGASGLMLGRGAMADPLLFERLRGRAPEHPDREEKASALRRYLAAALERYREVFCGPTQVLNKLKAILAAIEDPTFAAHFRKLRKARTLETFAELVDGIG
jgi:tRNA-dihydrouridine synthase